MRRSMLFCPANIPKFYKSAPLLKPDCIIFDLEDSVAMAEKERARDLLVKASTEFNLSTDPQYPEIFVRINALHTPFSKEDVAAVVRAGLSAIRLPMCESSLDIRNLDALLTEYEARYDRPAGSVKIQAAIETPKGVVNVMEIAAASSRMTSISFGAEDFTNSLGIQRLPQLPILDHARMQIAMACQIFGLDAIDTVWSDLSNPEGFIQETEKILNMGFSGKSCIHPSQIAIIHNLFSPSKQEVDQALKIITAFKEAQSNHSGVFLVDAKMVDKPIVERALKILNRTSNKY